MHGFTQLMVSHDLPLISHHATHVICLNRTVFRPGHHRPRSSPPDNLTSLFGVHMGMARAGIIAHGRFMCVSHMHGGRLRP